MKEKVKKKLQKVRNRRYIVSRYVSSLISYFPVPKGENDIRMVYDGTGSGLNNVLWVPRFAMQTLNTLLCMVSPDTFMADLDLGECFLNFPLHPSLQELCGVDLTELFSEDGSVLWEAWTRALMGAKSSPYQACQGIAVADEIARGKRTDPNNPFRWDRVVLNLPGDPLYNPSKPWVYKAREDGSVAADFVGFVDDFRPCGPSSADCWKACRRLGSLFSYLGLQDASRKRRDALQKAGAWTGAIVWTNGEDVLVRVSEEKFRKTQALIDEVLELIAACPTCLPRKRLEQIRGFLVYVTRTYPASIPYMKGLHLTIDFWRPNRDEEGWKQVPQKGRLIKLEESEIDCDDDEGAKWVIGYDEAPSEVQAVPRLAMDMKALKALFGSELPPVRIVRSRKRLNFFYGFADASGKAFGATAEINESIEFEFGQWCSAESEESSNWKELTNLARWIRRLVERHNLRGCEIFLFTDNLVAEFAFWKGNSSSLKLFEIVLALRQLEMTYSLTIHVVHVSGRRMIRQGTDGISRGDFSTGSMAGERITAHIPLHIDPLRRAPKLRSWIKQAFGTMQHTFLTPQFWFEDSHDFGNFIWFPPPAAADVVVDQLGKARHKRPESLHIIIVPRLMTGRWRRHLTRGTDIHFLLDNEVWDVSVQFEPLLIFCAVPFRSENPRLARRKQLLEKYGRGLSQMRQIPAVSGGYLLRKFLGDSRALCPM